MTREEAVQLLTEQSHDPMAALLALGRLGTAEDLRKILPFTQVDAKEIQLIAQGTVSTILKRVLTQENSNYSEESLQKLGTLLAKTDPVVLHEIKYRLHAEMDENDINYIRLLKYLQEDHRDTFKESVASLLVSSDSKVRATAATLLSSFFDSRDKDLFAELISDTDPRVRANAVEMIEELGDERLFYLLFRLKNDPHNRVRANAIKALYSMGRERVTDDLFHMLGSRDVMMQASALWVISQLDYYDEELELLCRKFVSSSNDIVAEQAKSACEKIAINEFNLFTGEL